jgi:exodeoxyribonuclease V alpha subunit
VLQQSVNPSGPSLTRGSINFRKGDRVMQLRNNYDKEVFNGDIGFIEALNEEDRQLVILFDGRPVTYDSNELDEIVHAYACTIHKSQGSEYPAVVIVLATQHFKLLQRNLLYTAVTRGRKLVCIVGSSKAIHLAIRNNEVRERRTTLAQRLKGR